MYGDKDDRDQLNWMLDWLDEHLKTEREHFYADPNHKQLPLGMPDAIFPDSGKHKDSGANSNKKNKAPTSTSTAANLFSQIEEEEEEFCEHFVAATDLSGNMGRGRGRGRGRGNSARGRGRGRGSNNSTTASGGSANNAKNSSTAKSDKDANKILVNVANRGQGIDIMPCVFCSSQHPARSCTQKMKPDTVYMKATSTLLCLNCLKAGHFANKCPHPGCEKDGCGKKHHKLIHGYNPPSRNQ